MMIRGGGNPHPAMAAMPLREWTRRLGALPAEAYDCFMVGTLYRSNRMQAWFAGESLVANGRLPSDHRVANHPITCSLPPCSRWSRTSLRRAEEASSLTLAARDGDAICGWGGRMLEPGRTKE